MANQRGPLLIYKNSVSSDNRWIEFSLEGGKSNRSAIGAEITLYWDGKEQLQQVSGGNGFASQNDRRVHFGLGKNPKIEKAVVRWPSGALQTLDNLAPDRLYTVKEPS